MTRPILADYRDVAVVTGQTVNHLRALYSRGVMPPRAHPRAPVWYLADIEEWVRTDPRATPSRGQTTDPVYAGSSTPTT